MAELEQRTWHIVFKRAPATLCSCGRANLAMKSVPAVKTRSGPMTEIQVPTKAYAQYVVEGSIMAKRRQAVVVPTAPTAARGMVNIFSSIRN